MKWFFDTSVLIPAFVHEHVHHERSAAALRLANRKMACCAAHSLAEVYSGLTRLPGKSRASSEQALLFLGAMAERLTIVALDSDEYFSVIRDAAAHGVVGGTIYDAILAGSAIKARAETIYTWNERHFRLLNAEVASRVVNP